MKASRVRLASDVSSWKLSQAIPVQQDQISWVMGALDQSASVGSGFRGRKT